MQTTLLNPTVWLLAATAATAIAGALRRRSARETLEQMLPFACSWPALVALLLMAGGGLASRAIVGYLSPGAYAEEVVAARTFLEQRRLYATDSRAELDQWLTETAGPAPPWKNLPGVSGCRANAMTNRARFFTSHAHTPMLLLAGVPIVHFGSGQALYSVLLLLSLAAVLAIVAVLLDSADVPWKSRRGLLLLAAVAGWQPVLAGVRQGDAVLPAVGFLTIAWYLTVRNRPVGGAFAGAVAACLALPAFGVFPALARYAPRAAALAGGVFLAIVAGTAVVAGADVIPGFLQTVAETARMYADALPNYALVGRAGASGLGTMLAGALALALICSWRYCRTMDRAFAAFSMLGLLIAPVVWSQHLAVVIVAAGVLLRSVCAHGSSLSLVAWALLVLSVSLPDAAAARVSELMSIPSPSGAVFPIVPAALILLWAWVTFGRSTRDKVVVAASRPS